MRIWMPVLAAAVMVAALAAPRSHAQSFTTIAGVVPAPNPNIPLYFEAHAGYFPPPPPQ